MSEITLTINGRQVKGKEGDTVLEICQANGVDVPALCHLEGLSDVGACRMCVVEIERERNPVPACTYPARYLSLSLPCAIIFVCFASRAETVSYRNWLTDTRWIMCVTLIPFPPYLWIH